MLRNDKISEDLLKENGKLKIDIQLQKSELTSTKTQLQEKIEYCDFLKEYINNNIDLSKKETMENDLQEKNERI